VTQDSPDLLNAILLFPAYRFLKFSLKVFPGTNRRRILRYPPFFRNLSQSGTVLFFHLLRSLERMLVLKIRDKLWTGEIVHLGKSVFPLERFVPGENL
jgi:hypothetical protein